MAKSQHVLLSSLAWSRISRREFEINIAKINSDTKIPHADQTGLEKPGEITGYPLPVDLEEQLANNFAFLALAEPGNDAVSAATVQAKKSPVRLVITLASNRGVPAMVEETFRAISSVLAQCAARGE